MTASHTSAWAGRLSRSRMSSASPPVLRRWLWQVTQYLSSSARCWVTGGTMEVEACCGAPWSHVGATARTATKLRALVECLATFVVTMALNTKTHGDFSGPSEGSQSPRVLLLLG